MEIWGEFDVEKQSFSRWTAGGGGICGFTSWNRLARLLQEHEVASYEALKRMVIDDCGITFYVDVKKADPT